MALIRTEQIDLALCKPYKDFGITLNELVKELTYKHLNHQYFFGTEKAISLLQRIL